MCAPSVAVAPDSRARGQWQCVSLKTKSACQAQQPGCAWQKNICVQVPSEFAAPTNNAL